jgi:O-antigen/teichoic acid export membrane protein
LALALFQEEVVWLLGGPLWNQAAYAQASAVIAPVLLAYFFQASASLMDAGLYVRHRTGLKLGITLATTTVMLLMYALLIPTYGSMGAALATLIGFVFLALCTWAVSRRVFLIRYEWPRLAALLTLTIGLWLLSRLLPVAWWVWPAKAGLWLLGPVLIWYTGLMSRSEKEQMHALIGAAKSAFIHRYKPGTPAISRESLSLELLARRGIVGGDRHGNQLSGRHS